MNNGARSSQRRERRAFGLEKRQAAHSWQPQKGEASRARLHVCTSARLHVCTRYCDCGQSYPHERLHAAPADCPFSAPFTVHDRPMPGRMPVAITVQLACASCPGHPLLRLPPPPCTLAPLKSTIALGSLSLSPAIFLNLAPSVVWPLLHDFAFSSPSSATRAPSTCSISPARH